MPHSLSQARNVVLLGARMRQVSRFVSGPAATVLASLTMQFAADATSSQFSCLKLPTRVCFAVAHSRMPMQSASHLLRVSAQVPQRQLQHASETPAQRVVEQLPLNAG